MLYLSKSGYCRLWQCPKMAWLQQYKPEERQEDTAAQSRMATGNRVGDLAMGLFGEYVEVTAYTDGKLDLNRMLAATAKEMAKATPVICEASFRFNGLYCAVDILRRQGDGWAIYEVKSATHAEKPVYLADVAYQKYVLEHCGVPVTGTYVVTVNSAYVFDGTLRLEELFNITDVAPLIEAEGAAVGGRLAVAELLLQSPEEPAIDLHEGCNSPYPCEFWGYCTRQLPTPSVFDLYRMGFAKQLDYYRRGLVGYDALLADKAMKNPMRRRQMEHQLIPQAPHIDKEGIRGFLRTLSYPLYFLDFETMQPVIPLFPGTRPYAQIPFQYSLHYIEEEGGELKHKEFLAASGADPRRTIAQRLCEDIPRDACVTAYNKAFECGRLKELAETFPAMAEHLLSIAGNIRDLLEPFQKGYYYTRAMGGSFSIKSVLPALFPDDPALDYHNLEGVHNGGEAMELFPLIQEMPPREQEIARRNLLDYCKLDTYAMVKVWQKLVEAAK